MKVATRRIVANTYSSGTVHINRHIYKGRYKMAKQQAPVKKNQTITLQFEDLTHQGSGVGKVDGYPLFVPFALPGEEASVKVVKVNKKFGYGRLLEVHKKSPDRVDPPCHVYEQCGGCQLQHMS